MKLCSQPFSYHSAEAENIKADTGSSVTFVVGASTYAVISAAGNVGIGTVNPQANLEVTGDIKVTGGIRFQDGTYQVSASSGNNSGGTSNWTTSGSNVYRLSGNVGIGTTAPQTGLEVENSNNILGIWQMTVGDTNAMAASVGGGIGLLGK